MNTYTILASKVDVVKNNIKKWNKKGADFAAVNFSIPYTTMLETIIDREVCEFPVQVVDVEIVGEYHPSKKHALVAKLDKAGEANLIWNVSSETKAPEKYRVYDNHCDHCNKNRARNVHYLIKSLEGGEILKVGSSCLADFFPKTAGECVKAAQWWCAIIETLEDLDYKKCTGTAQELNVERLLKISLGMTTKYGYTSTSDTGCDISTKELTLSHYMHPLPSFIESLDVQPMLAWLAAQPAEGDYMHNLKAATANTFTGAKAVGVICSLPSAYLKALEREKMTAQVKADNDTWPDDGKQIIEGRIVSFKTYFNEYGATVKMLVQCEGFRLFGSVPKSLRGVADIGDTIQLSAMVDALEAGFGKFSRPTQGKRLG